MTLEERVRALEEEVKELVGIFDKYIAGSMKFWNEIREHLTDKING